MLTTVALPYRPPPAGRVPDARWCPPCGRSGRRRACGRQVRDELLQPGPQRRTQVVALAGKPDHRLEVVQPVAGVVPAAAEHDPVHGLTLLDEGGQRIGQLDLAP